jgi:DNA-3-methyladenine glycosylase II
MATVTKPDHKRAITAISAADPVVAGFIKRAGSLPDRPPVGDHFAALARSIMYQQIAGAAAAAIHARFVDAVGGAVTAEAVLRTRETKLRKAGLSGAKAASIQDLAQKVADGTVPLSGIAALSDDEIVARLVTVRGIGRWTAEMFLLFELRRPDVWPVYDYGVRQGWTLIQRLPDLIKPKALMDSGDPFKPHRSTLARYCWYAVHLSRVRDK